MIATDDGVLTRLTDVLGPGPGGGWLVLPSPGRPRHLVPVPRRAAAAAVRARGAERGTMGRAASVALAAALRTGAGRLVPVRLPQGDGPSLTTWLEDLLGLDGLRVAVGLGPPRPNRKPVLQVLDRRGTTVGFAKVGWDEATARLVRNEARFLGGPGRGLAPDVLVPHLVAEAKWLGLDVALTRPLPLDGRPRRQLTPPLEALAAMAASAGPVVPGAGAWWERTAVRVDGTPDAVALAPVVRRLADRLDATGLPMGAWHGDLTPWNATVVDGRLLAWDWERTASPVPVGLDAAHLAFSVAALREGRDVATSGARALRAVGPVLLGLGVDPERLSTLVVACYLLEVYLRADEDRRSRPEPAPGLDRRCAEVLALLVPVGGRP